MSQTFSLDLETNISKIDDFQNFRKIRQKFSFPITYGRGLIGLNFENFKRSQNVKLIVSNERMRGFCSENGVH